MRLAPEHLDEIRASVDWQRLFDGMGLRKAERKSKPNDWWAFSPFHDEKTPSFHMGPGGIWYDFSTGEGGGPIELVQQLQHCNCFEAGRFIIENGWADARIEVSAARSSSRKIQRRVQDTVAISEENPDFSTVPGNEPIHQDLLPMCTGHEMLETRGISDGTRDLLGIGYLPQGRSPLKGRIVFQVADARQGKSGNLDRVILSHIGRAVSETQNPKYLFYEGFHKSAELYGQELIWLHEDAETQIRDTGHIVLSEGPFDVAKAVEAGFRNVVGSLGATLSETQARKLKGMAEHFGISRILIAYDRDDAGKVGAEKAAIRLQDVGLTPAVFDWESPIGQTRDGPAHIPSNIHDLGDLTPTQLQWLRGKGLL